MENEIKDNLNLNTSFFDTSFETSYGRVRLEIINDPMEGNIEIVPTITLFTPIEIRHADIKFGDMTEFIKNRVFEELKNFVDKE